MNDNGRINYKLDPYWALAFYPTCKYKIISDSVILMGYMWKMGFLSEVPCRYDENNLQYINVFIFQFFGREHLLFLEIFLQNIIRNCILPPIGNRFSLSK
jgi:hypothetical protein